MGAWCADFVACAAKPLLMLLRFGGFPPSDRNEFNASISGDARMVGSFDRFGPRRAARRNPARPEARGTGARALACTALLWLAPLGILGVGAVTLLLAFRRRGGRRPEPAAPLSEAEQARLAELT